MMLSWVKVAFCWKAGFYKARGVQAAPFGGVRTIASAMGPE
jgi:hypothetical protein